MGTGMIRTQIYLTPEIKRELDLLKKRDGLGMGQVIRKVLHAALIKDRSFPNKQKKGNGLLELAKLGIKGGPKDLSARMDEYLYGE